MSNGYSFYIQRYPENNEEPERIKIEHFFKCKYQKFDNLVLDGEIQNVYSESYSERDGARVHIPNQIEISRKPYDCTLTLLFKGEQLKGNIRKFYKYIYGRKIEWYDTFRKRHATLLCTTRPNIVAERLIKGVKFASVEFKFTNIAGRTFAGSQMLDHEQVRLELYGDNKIFVRTSRPLKDDEAIALLTCGSLRRTNMKGNIPIRGKIHRRWHTPKWQIDITNTESPQKNLRKLKMDSEGRYPLPLDIPQWDFFSNKFSRYLGYVIHKTKNSNYKVYPTDYKVYEVTYGIAVVKRMNGRNTSRISNVCYISSWITGMAYNTTQGVRIKK